ncbi:DUF1902 domain-containing protein [Corticibacter populi]|uniref:DUF1902 domain-containing protein n=2 Tax=Corticibacter populi TaxID=1550736 RepID=A0A3M6R0S8_9BURK|nr:DUF1902 domain-containing protein [Corticibacter populi]
MKIHLVNADWDPEAQVWVASSNDVPGLATEAHSLDDLQRKLDVMVPELLEANDLRPEKGDVVELLARRITALQPGIS